MNEELEYSLSEISRLVSDGEYGTARELVLRYYDDLLVHYNGFMDLERRCPILSRFKGKGSIGSLIDKFGLVLSSVQGMIEAIDADEAEDN